MRPSNSAFSRVRDAGHRLHSIITTFSLLLREAKLVEGLEGMSCEDTWLVWFGEKKARGDLTALCSSLGRGNAEAGTGLFPPVMDVRTRGNGTKLQQGRLKLVIRKNSLS